MVIFHSYVSLPEGISNLPAPGLCRRCHRCRRQRRPNRLGPGADETAPDRATETAQLLGDGNGAAGGKNICSYLLVNKQLDPAVMAIYQL